MYTTVKNGIDGIALPPLGPSNYDAIRTNAVAGIDINIEEAWRLCQQAENRKRPVTVAVLDTGIDTSHPDLKDAIWVNEDEIPGDGIDNDGNGYIDDVNGWNFISNNNRIYVGDEDSRHPSRRYRPLLPQRPTAGARIADSGYVRNHGLKALGGEDSRAPAS